MWWGKIWTTPAKPQIVQAHNIDACLCTSLGLQDTYLIFRSSQAVLRFSLSVASSPGATTTKRCVAVSSSAHLGCDGSAKLPSSSGEAIQVDLIPISANEILKRSFTGALDAKIKACILAKFS